MERGGIGKDSLKLTVSQMGALIIGLVSTMLLSRFRTLGEYGTYSQMYLIAGILSPILMMGIPASLSYFLARASDDSEKREVLSQNLISVTVLGIFTFSVIVLSRNFLESYFSNPMLGSMIVIIALFPWSRTISDTMQHILVIYNKSAGFLFYKISHSLMILAAVVIAVSMKLDFTIYMTIFISVETVYAVLVYIISARVSGGLKWYFSMPLMKKILAYSIPIGLSGAISSLNRHIDELVIGRFFSTEDLAVYVNSARELPLRLLGISIATAMVPRFILMVKENNMKGAVMLWKESIKLSYVFMCFFSTVLIVYAPEIISILYSAKYLPGVTVFRIYAIIMLMSVTHFYMVISSLGKTKYILYTTVGTILLNVVLSILFYRLLGFVGPAVATLISFLVFRFSQLIISVKLSDIGFSEIMPWGTFGIIGIVNAGFGGLFALLREVVHLESSIGWIPESVLLGFFWMILYFGIYFKYIKNKWDILNKGGED